MISGISSPGGYFPQSFVTKVKTAAAPQTPTTPSAEEGNVDAAEAGLRAPSGDQNTLARELNLFDLAQRQFAEILPRLEVATAPVD